ncbi:MAG: hypothetical protein GY835_20050 [bacterium]|nr:hypothetical protein [bacterium]
MTEEEREMLESMDDEGGGGKAADPKLKRLIMLTGIVLIQVAAAWAVAQFVILPRLPGDPVAGDSTEVAEETVEVDDADRERGSIVMMDNVVVNLQTLSGDTRFLSVTTGIEFNEKKLDAEIAERMPELRAMLIDQLSSCTVEDVINRQGREVVKEEILKDFNKNLQSGSLLNIYFSDFVIQ